MASCSGFGKIPARPGPAQKRLSERKLFFSEPEFTGIIRKFVPNN